MKGRAGLRVLCVFSAIVALAAVGCGEDAAPGRGLDREAAVVAAFEQIRLDPDRLARFIGDMPKGGDIHSHPSGAVTTESLIEWGSEAGQCVSPADYTGTDGPCVEPAVPISNAATDSVLHENIVEAWSLANFVGTLLERHAHFFATFGKFGAITSVRGPGMLAQLRKTAAQQKAGYLELFSSFGSGTAGSIATSYLDPADSWDPAYLLAKRTEVLADPDFQAALRTGLDYVVQTFIGSDMLLGCVRYSQVEGCAVVARYLVTADRTHPREYVFGQILYGFELSRLDPRIVGVNLVGEEDDATSLADYDDDMLAVGTLADYYRADPARSLPHVSLHAGELVSAVLPQTPEGQRQLTFHVRRAVEVGRAERIGHGTDILDEYESPDATPETLMAEMKQRGVLVERCLTSNYQLLGIEPSQDPTLAYHVHGVPTILGTDDAGVLDTDLSHEYAQAVEVQDMDYPGLERQSRNSLAYSFLQGEDLWQDRETFVPVEVCASSLPGTGSGSIAPACQSYLTESPRATIEWRLEADLVAFEDRVIAGQY